MDKVFWMRVLQYNDGNSLPDRVCDQIFLFSQPHDKAITQSHILIDEKPRLLTPSDMSCC